MPSMQDVRISPIFAARIAVCTAAVFAVMCSSNNNNSGTQSASSGGSPNFGDGGIVTDCSETPKAHPLLQQTVCDRTVPESVEPSIACTPKTIGVNYDGCSGANTACGAVTGCLLERNEAIDSKVQTTYSPPPAGFAPPPPPHDPGSSPIPGMGRVMSGTTSGWFARGDGTPAIGSCGFPEVRNLMVTAISHTQFGTSDDPSRFDSAYWCGACAEIVGRSGHRVRVMIIDQCTGCDANYLDMPAGDNTPFSMMDDPNFNDTCPPNGEQPVDWKIVPCETCGGIVVHYVEGFNAGTPSIQIRNHRLPIVRLEELRATGVWQEVRRESHNEYYLPRDNEDELPLDLRITAFDGSTITGTFPIFKPGMTYEASSQF